jgi:hypothetical protein
MAQNTNNEGRRSDGIIVAEEVKDDALDDVSNRDSGSENVNNASENIADPVSVVEPVPFERLNQTMMTSTASENFAALTPAIEHSKVKFGVFPHGWYAFIPALFSLVAWFA